MGGSVAKALSAFSDGSDLHLWVHQAFDDLCRADVASEGGIAELRTIAPRTSTAANEGPDVRHMTYEEFMTARGGGRGRSGRRDSTLAGTHCDSVRALLNRLSGGTSSGPGPTGRDDDDTWMDLGDEDGELAQAIDSAPPPLAEEPAVRSAPDMAAYERHVKNYVQTLTSGKGSLGPRDVLRLRLWIMLILQEARCELFPKGMPATVSENGWPRLVVRILSAFFWGRRSGLSRLVVADDYAEMPVDFLECWATALWALDAIGRVVTLQPKSRDFLRRLPALRAHIVLTLGLLPTDLKGETMTARWNGLDAEIGERLGLGAMWPAT